MSNALKGKFTLSFEPAISGSVQCRDDCMGARQGFYQLLMVVIVHNMHRDSSSTQRVVILSGEDDDVVPPGGFDRFGNVPRNS